MRQISGETGVRDNLRPFMGSEDFGFILQRVPGAYGLIGNGSSTALHNPAYDFNADAILVGVEFWVRLAKLVLP